MADFFSQSYVDRAQRRLRFTPLWWRLKFASVIKKYRLWSLHHGAHDVVPAVAPCFITDSLDRQMEHFRAHQWAFAENIFSKEFHQELVANWPKRYFLEPPREAAKSYNTGWRWIYGKPLNFDYFDPYHQYPIFVSLLNYLRAPEFVQRVQTVISCPDKLVCYSFILSDSYPGSEVYPHIDGIIKDPQAKLFINMVFFIEGTGGPNSGALMLSKDNEQKEIIFEPPTIVNSSLVYDSLTDFYHGFPPIAPGKFRRAITVQFCERGYIEKKNN